MINYLIIGLITSAVYLILYRYVINKIFKITYIKEFWSDEHMKPIYEKINRQSVMYGFILSIILWPLMIISMLLTPLCIYYLNRYIDKYNLS